METSKIAPKSNVMNFQLAQYLEIENNESYCGNSKTAVTKKHFKDATVKYEITCTVKPPNSGYPK